MRNNCSQRPIFTANAANPVPASQYLHASEARLPLWCGTYVSLASFYSQRVLRAGRSPGPELQITIATCTTCLVVLENLEPQQ